MNTDMYNFTFISFQHNAHDLINLIGTFLFSEITSTKLLGVVVLIDPVSPEWTRLYASEIISNEKVEGSWRSKMATAAPAASCMSTKHGCVMFDCLVHLWEW
ncbi:unnamed protein product [Arctia plantaginis]|uniref:Uncharacterized protein n=1 Tax=Arctia plantaginis TaxID=874455 RepID=A0A8S0ZKP7_ARCPL|nr:unnamed protein product [Arctia plantaginis]CAB3238426.1 unnamed protein product [Arctia plantaginis]